ncbi:MAG: hypothetical protein Q9182_004774 [Xanthomendoza sp. 2 TL-2023]
MKSSLSLLAFGAGYFAGAQYSQTIVSIPSIDTYLLPTAYHGNGSIGFVDTQVPKGPLDNLFAAARTAAFVSYSSTFLDILGPNPRLDLVAQRSDLFATEGGIWVPSHNEIWFTSSGVSGAPVTASVLNLDTNTITSPNLSTPLIFPAGGYFFNKLIYFATIGNDSTPGGIVTVDPNTNQANTIVNTFFGLPFNCVDDVVAIRRGRNILLFFTDPDYTKTISTFPPASLPNAVWRFDPQAQSLQAVISRDDIRTPNGIKTSADGKKLYVTDGTQSGTTGSGGVGNPAIYEFDLDSEARPVNKKLFAIARTGIPDGIQVDDFGNVWTAEGEGIIVRDPSGKVIGLINAEALWPRGEERVAIANFALARNKVVVLTGRRIFVASLRKGVMGAGRFGV